MASIGKLAVSIHLIAFRAMGGLIQTLLINVAVGQMVLSLADGVDDVGEHLAVAGRASILRGLLVSSAQLLVLVVEVAAGGISTTVSICIFNRASG